ncbi:CRP/FNR family transcriptional regulator, anaerobic regulatory protein [Raineyella antarctica]|uniref:CRP/FNR family transcriptional regulator, anaerobic regulatory protein n=1 Tax=Raineyella antarctica TaxID=1577474 RepID=A0A1G6GFB4_9ACTN|nr:Crp/Fnr family transcriptional regulator [Raineyella antarctica]SDB80687.1 CRP/FNR family transcriptional regulator, anaerobic regulatory protein [Raineyella antarctica]
MSTPTPFQAYPTLNLLSSELQDLVRRNGRQVQAPPGTVLFDLGSSCTGFLLVLAGVVEVSRPHVDGRSILLYRLEAGDTCVLTLNCLFGEVAYEARAVVRDPVLAVQLPKGVFHRLVDESPEFRHTMLALLTRRLTRVVRLLEATAFVSVQQRLAGELLARGPVVPATHQELAAAVGSVREVVSRQLATWAHAGWVATDRGRVTVLDPGALEQVLEPLGGP